METTHETIPVVPGRRLRALRRVENWLIAIAFAVVLIG